MKLIPCKKIDRNRIKRKLLKYYRPDIIISYRILSEKSTWYIQGREARSRYHRAKKIIACLCIEAPEKVGLVGLIF